MAHVEKRGKNSWRLVVTIGYDEKGIPIRERETVKAKNKTEAVKLLSIFEAEILTGKYIKAENITLKDLYREWLDNNAGDSLSPKTMDNYINILDARILPLYGHMKLADIMPIHVLNFVSSLGRDGSRLDGKKGPLSTSSINNCYKAFNNLLSFAKKMRWISENPASDITPPTVRQPEVKIYTPHELSLLITGLNNMDIEFKSKVMIFLALATSARQGEIAAIEGKHFDFERKGVHILQALSIKKGEGVILKETKNKRKRFISLPANILDMIKVLIAERTEETSAAGDYVEWPNHLFLFANDFGKPIRPDSISQWWIRLLESDKFKELGLKKIRFHDLRHSSLTLLSRSGLRPKAVQERAGHERIGTTFDIYGHALLEEEQEAAGFIGDIFDSSK